MLSTDYDAPTASAVRIGASSGAVTRGRGRSERMRGREDLALRLRVRWQQRQLDHDLAAGMPASGSPERELRATQLADRRSRAMLAHSLRRLLSIAESRRRGLSPMIAPASGAVLDDRATLLALAERIDGDTPLAAAGLAQTRLLLADGAGPLYSRAARESLEAKLLVIVDALDEH